MVFKFFNLVLKRYGKLFLTMCGDPGSSWIALETRKLTEGQQSHATSFGNFETNVKTK